MLLNSFILNKLLLLFSCVLVYVSNSNLWSNKQGISSIRCASEPFPEFWWFCSLQSRNKGNYLETHFISLFSHGSYDSVCLLVCCMDLKHSRSSNKGVSGVSQISLPQSKSFVISFFPLKWCMYLSIEGKKGGGNYKHKLMCTHMSMP